MKKKLLSIFVAAAVLLATMFTAVSCAKPGTELLHDGAIYAIPSTSTKYISNIDRKLPTASDGGLAEYPSIDKAIKDSAMRKAIFAENQAMFAYDYLDENGNMYATDADGKSAPTGEKLFKHSAADKIYSESIPDSAQATIAKVKLKPSNLGNNLTGLYAQPGELITVIIDDNIVKKGGVRVDIGGGTQRGGGINIPLEKKGVEVPFTHMPIMRKSLNLKNSVNYIGTPLGGPIYIHTEALMNKDSKTELEVTIIGAVAAPQYYFGGTSDSEWEKSREYPAPFFHFETRAGIRLSMPSKFIRGKSAEEMFNLGLFWENAANLSNKINGGAWYRNHPVDMYFDSYVPAGAAVAFVGADFCVCPTSWAPGTVNYVGLVSSGNWGVLHEFNHHHGAWGAGAGGEVTNNVATSLMYMLNTNIASNRSEGGGLGTSWNKFTDSYQSLNDTLGRYSKGQVNRELNMYNNFSHAFGADFIIELASKTPIIKKYDPETDKNVEDDLANMTQFYYQASMISGYDMTYYLRDICGFTIEADKIKEITDKKMPVFAPIASPYQTSIALSSGDYVAMGKAYYTSMGIETELDFDKIVTLPNINTNVRVVLGDKNKGKFTHISGNKYSYIPSDTNNDGDEVTLEISRTGAVVGGVIPDTKIKILLKGDVSGVNAKMWKNAGYADIDAALSSGIESTEPISITKNSFAGMNTDIPNTIGIMEGVLVLPKGDYNLALRGDDMSRLIITDRKELTLAANTKGFFKYDLTKPESLINLTVGDAQLYFKLIMFNGGGIGNARIGHVQVDEDGVKSVEDLPSNFIRNINYNPKTKTKFEYEQERKYSTEFVASGEIVDRGETPIVTLAPPKRNDDLGAEFMIDGKLNTMFHSATKMKFPCEFVIDFGRKVSFNNIRIVPRQDGNVYGRVKEYVFECGDDPSTLTEVKSGVGENAYNGFDVATSAKSARYIKITVNSVHSGDYVAISEIIPMTILRTETVLTATSSKLNYSGEWRDDNYGSVLNGLVKSATKGSITFRFKGTGFAIFGNKGRDLGKADVIIDGKRVDVANYYNDKDINNATIFVICDLPDKTHDVEILASDGEINVNYIGLTATGDIVKGGLPSKSVVIIIVLSVLAAVAIIVSLLIGFITVKRKKSLVKHDIATNEVVYVSGSVGKQSDTDTGIGDNDFIEPIRVQSPPKPIITKIIVDEPENKQVIMPKDGYKPIPKAKAQTIVEPKQNVATVPKAKPVAEPKVKAVVEPKAKPVAEPKVKAVVEPKVKAVVEPKAKPVAAPKAKPVAEPKVKAVVEPKVKVVAEPKVKVVAEPKINVEVSPKPIVKSKSTTKGKSDKV